MIDYHFKHERLLIELENIDQEIKELIDMRAMVAHDLDNVTEILFDTRLGS